MMLCLTMFSIEPMQPTRYGRSILMHMASILSKSATGGQSIQFVLVKIIAPLA